MGNSASAAASRKAWPGISSSCGSSRSTASSYVGYTILSGEWRHLVPNRHSFKEAWQVVLHDLHLSKVEPPRRKFNGAQQFAYTTVILMGAGSLLTGLAIYKPVQLAWLTSLFGGYEWARLFHLR